MRKRLLVNYILPLLTFGLMGGEKDFGEPDNPMKEQSPGGRSINSYRWHNNIKGFMSEMERRRKERLIKTQGHKFHEVNGLKILALNRKNAERKYNLYHG